MKWYSIKKYKPSSYSGVICRVIDQEYGETFLTGCYSQSDDCWDFDDIPINERHRITVTHFLIPEPIEIE